MNIKEKANELVKIAKERGLIVSYSEWCKTDEAKEYALTKEEIEHCNKLSAH